MQRSILEDYHNRRNESHQLYSLKGIAAESFLSGHLPFGLTYSKFAYGGLIQDSRSRIISAKSHINKQAYRRSVDWYRERARNAPVYKKYYWNARSGVQADIAKNLKNRTAFGNIIAKEQGIIKSANLKAGIVSKTSLAASLLLFGIDAGFSLSRDFSRKLVEESERLRENNEMPFLDTGMTHTSRQRALAQIHNSQLHARAVLGNEAGYMMM